MSVFKFTDMSKDNALQIQFLNRIKELIPDSNSFTDEIADVLDISSDSVYRRLRGETLLSINEIYDLCTHYNISFDLFTAMDSKRSLSLPSHSLSLLITV